MLTMGRRSQAETRTTDRALEAGADEQLWTDPATSHDTYTGEDAARDDASDTRDSAAAEGNGSATVIALSVSKHL